MLEKTSDKDAVGRNIEKEVASGKPRKQAIAIALSVQRKAKRTGFKKGGPVTPQPPSPPHPPSIHMGSHHMDSGMAAAMRKLMRMK